MSKALSGGFVPIGAMVCSTKVSDKVYSSMDRAIVHSSTFKNNQLAMVAALATLATIDDENLVDRARMTGDAFDKALAPLIERHETFHAVRGKGLMIGLVFGEPKSFRQRTRFRLLEAARTGLFSQIVVGPLFTRHGILTQVAADSMNVVKLLPPLVIGQYEVDYFAAALDDVLTDAERNSSLHRRIRQDARQGLAATRRLITGIRRAEVTMPSRDVRFVPLELSLCSRLSSQRAAPPRRRVVRRHRLRRRRCRSSPASPARPRVVPSRRSVRSNEWTFCP